MKSKKILKKLIYIVAIGCLILIPINGFPRGWILAILIAFTILMANISLSKKAKKKKENQLPDVSTEKEAHYQEIGLEDSQIKFFRETMATAKEQIVQLEKNMNEVAKLKAINISNDTVKIAKAMFKELVKEPQKLHQADGFLYNHLPNLVDLTNKYLEINAHESKSKNTYQALQKSALVIDQVSKLLVLDYQKFVADDLDELAVEMTIAQQNIAKEKSETE